MKKLPTSIDSRLINHLHYQQKLAQIIIKALSLTVTPTCLWPIRSMKRLTIYTNNQLLATRIHFDQNTLKHYLAQHHQIRIDEIIIRITTPPALKKTKQLKPRKLLSDQSIKVLIAASKAIKDKELSDCLLHIAQTNNN